MASKLCLGLAVADNSMPCYCQRAGVAQNQGELPINWNVCANTFISNNNSSIIVIGKMGPWTWKWNSCDGNDRPPILRPIKQFKFSIAFTFFREHGTAFRKYFACIQRRRKNQWQQPKSFVKLCVHMYASIIFRCQKSVIRLRNN